MCNKRNNVGAISEIMPVGRPKKKWRACLTEDMNTLGIEEYMAHDRQL